MANNQQRIDKEVWNFADVNKVVCPECGVASVRMTYWDRRSNIYMAKVKCDCGWFVRRPMETETIIHEGGDARH